MGISVILAQAGFYVPCTTFHYKPYTTIFSRILGNDNIFKGLSTFAVEMSELRVILRLADENSLILGDELCSGTETESALSIFTAGLMNLHEKRSTFLFATHFHEICNYDEIQGLDRMRLTHMSVHYDAEIDALVYDRILKEGPGTRMYGLEVCKSLYLGKDFLEKAYEIRNKYHPLGELSFGKSHFNQKKIVGICEICKSELAEEVHHLSPQRGADKNGFIKTDTMIFHKNHKANLTSVCSACHDKIHSNDKIGIEKTEKQQKITRKKKTTKGYIITDESI
jgi:DNA mismatch repair protein MutS